MCLRNEYPDERPSFLLCLFERHIVFCSVRTYAYEKVFKEYGKRSEVSRTIWSMDEHFFFLSRRREITKKWNKLDVSGVRCLF